VCVLSLSLCVHQLLQQPPGSHIHNPGLAVVVRPFVSNAIAHGATNFLLEEEAQGGREGGREGVGEWEVNFELWESIIGRYGMYISHSCDGLDEADTMGRENEREGRRGTREGGREGGRADLPLIGERPPWPGWWRLSAWGW